MRTPFHHRHPSPHTSPTRVCAHTCVLDVETFLGLGGGLGLGAHVCAHTRVCAHVCAPVETFSGNLGNAHPWKRLTVSTTTVRKLGQKTFPRRHPHQNCSHKTFRRGHPCVDVETFVRCARLDVETFFIVRVRGNVFATPHVSTSGSTSPSSHSTTWKRFERTKRVFAARCGNVLHVETFCKMRGRGNVFVDQKRFHVEGFPRSCRTN